MLRKRFQASVLTVLVLALCVAIPACLPAPLGDPEKSTINEALIGNWLYKDKDGAHILYSVARFDARTYVVDSMSFKEVEGKIEPVQRQIYKAWLTDVKGNTFITLQPVLQSVQTGNSASVYLVARLTINHDKLTVRGIDGEKPETQDLKTPELVSKYVEANLDNDAVYAASRAMEKVPAGPEVERLVREFHGGR